MRKRQSSLEERAGEVFSRLYNWAAYARSWQTGDEYYICPNCGADVDYHLAGVGKEFTCTCGWKYYWHVSEKYVSRSFSPSPDGMRSGSYSTSANAVNEDGTPPIKKVRESSNLAFEVTNRAESCLLIPKSLSGVEVPKASVPQVPSDLSPDELVYWWEKLLAALEGRQPRLNLNSAQLMAEIKKS